jgi:adenylate kinase family enzyme
MVMGASGSGKTVLGEQVAEVLGFDFVDLDTLWWKPNWVHAAEDDFKRDVDSATASDTWVTAGNYRRELAATLWLRADTLVWLDLPLPLLVARILRRAWRQWRSRELRWGTCPENFWRHLKLWDKDSLVRWVVTSHRRRRREHLAMMYDPAWKHLRIVRLCSADEVATFSRSLRTD